MAYSISSAGTQCELRGQNYAAKVGKGTRGADNYGAGSRKGAKPSPKGENQEVEDLKRRLEEKSNENVKLHAMIADLMEKMNSLQTMVQTLVAAQAMQQQGGQPNAAGAGSPVAAATSTANVEAEI